MDCKICLEKYDHSKHRPYCLLPCAHTFCAECLRKQTYINCPDCRSNVIGQNPNWGLIQLLGESNYDKIKSESLANLNNANDLKNQIDKLRTIKADENSTRINELKFAINTKADNLIKLIEKDRARLLGEVKNVEDYLNKKLNESKINPIVISKFQQIEKQVNGDVLSESELTSLNTELTTRNLEFNNKLVELEKLNNTYEFSSLSYDNFLIGDISNKNWISNPKTDAQFINLGRTYHEQLKNYKKALDMYNRSIELNPYNSIAYRNKGLLYYDTREYKLALESYEKAIELEPTNKNGYLGKSNVLRALKMYDNAIESYDQVIKLDPNHIIAYYTKGNIYRELKKFKEAIESYDKTIAINKNYTNSYYSKGLVLKELKNYEQAIDYFNKVIEIDPFYINAYLSKAYALRDLKKYDEAVVNFDKCLEIDSNFTVALNSKNNLLKLQQIKV